MTLYLHRNLAAMAALTGDATRYAMSAVRVRDPGNGLYRVEATDGKRLAIIQGSSADVSYPALEEAGEGTTELLVPRNAWVQAFKLGDKKRPVGIGASEGSVILAVGDQSLTASLVDGRYPDVESVIPKQGPLVSVRVNPDLLAELLKLAMAIEPEGITLLYFGKDMPIGLIASNDQGQTFDAMLMPLT